MSKSSLFFAVSAALFTPLSLAEKIVSANELQPNEVEHSDLEQIIVTSDFRKQSLAQTPTSIAIIDQQQIIDEGSQHFTEIINRVANINYAGGSSRAKYFQNRGVGERSEYRGAPNSSVGFIVDDIDISGLGMAANMFDVQQVEVLRGPQGTRFGANALAGLIYIKSNDPTNVFEHGMQTSIGDDELLTISGYSSGPLTEGLSYRIVLQQHQQNGFRQNLFLNRDDTNGLDEFTGKFKLAYSAGENLTINFTYLHADLENGYDVWTLDNNGYTTLTDKPGVDEQRSNGSAFNIKFNGFNNFQIESITSLSQTDHQHAYDGDWANPDYWADKACTDYYDENANGLYDDAIPCVYDYSWAKKADRKHYSQEVRLSSKEQGRIFSNTTDWLAGFYLSDLEESNAIDESYNGWLDEVDSKYTARNYAIFGQVDSQLPDDYQLSLGLRAESGSSDYRDSLGDDFNPDESMWGGHIALSKVLSSSNSIYARIARGYKAGGFNMGLVEQLNQYKEFDSETLINYEFGLKSQIKKHDLSTNLSFFYMDRQDQQVNASIQNPDEPQRFVIYTANATSSTSYGLEFDLNWQVNNQIEFYSTLGYLNASYDEYAYQDKYGSKIDISGRDLAHSPEYTYSAGLTYRNDIGWFVNINLSGKSSFYFSDSHDEKAKVSNISNARLGYEAQDWSIVLWVHNLTDEKVATRGFYFGNEPDLDWKNKKYVRFKAPRLVGVTLDYQF